MSDLSLQLQQAASQLPVSSYFDEALFRRELDLIWQRGPRYVGHELAVPEVGNYHTLAHEGEGRALVRTPQGVEVISNVCRHRQAVILRGRGSVGEESAAGGNIVCPLHRWTYSAGQHAKAGTLLAAPHFATDPCLNLTNYQVQTWNGLVFEDNGFDVAGRLAKLGPKSDLDFSGYVYDRTLLHEVDYNWKTFIEVYLEDYHVGPFHPGLGNFVTCEDLRWEFGREYSVQTVGVAGKLGKPGSDVYRKWHDEVLRYQDGRMPKHGAVWLTLYPNVMVEWYPNVLVVSTLFPKGPQKTLNLVEFFYPEEIVAFERDFVEAQQAAYLETCEEDDEIALRMDAGRKALMDRGDNEAGPYQSPMEDGMQHFHEWYRETMSADAALGVGR
jgi:choline monooxygenase